MGAGILALPAVTSPAGFVPSAATMVAVWALLAAEAMLLAESNLAIRAQQVLSMVQPLPDCVNFRRCAAGCRSIASLRVWHLAFKLLALLVADKTAQFPSMPATHVAVEFAYGVLHRAGTRRLTRAPMQREVHGTARCPPHLQAEAMADGDGGSPGMVTLHQMAEASFGQAGASATSFVYLGALGMQ